jgi:drug/metabolite transporter (DMT)-like permease
MIHYASSHSGSYKPMQLVAPSAVTSCLCLGEPFLLKYILAATLTTAGIYIINKGKV